MTALIPDINSKVEFSYAIGGGSATIIDFTCYTFAIELGSDTELIDIGTFCAPSATGRGRNTWSLVLSMLWEAELMDLIYPAAIGHPGELIYTPDTRVVTPANKQFVIQTEIPHAPVGRFELGQRVEVELAMPVYAEPQWVAPVAAAATAPAPKSAES
jgi:hypothetical protein